MILNSAHVYANERTCLTHTLLICCVDENIKTPPDIFGFGYKSDNKNERLRTIFMLFISSKDILLWRAQQ